MPSIKRPIGASGAALAIALLAAACGSGTTETASTAAAEPTAAESATETPAESQSQPEEAGPAAEAEGPQPVIEHSFPDLDTVSISDGSSLNLATELAGGDTPILLWFFAPH